MRGCNLARRILAVILLAGAVAGDARSETVWARVRSDRVNLRARPDLQAEVVAQAHTGDRLAVRSEIEGWVEIIAPESVDVWAYREFIRDGVVTVNKLNLRAGPGINYSIVGSLPAGSPVTIRGQFGEWLKVAPTNATLWVSREFVELTSLTPDAEMAPEAGGLPERASSPEAPSPPSGPAEPGEQESAPRIHSSVPPAEESGGAVILPSAPSDLRLVPLEGQGRFVKYEGELKPAPFLINRPSDFRLVRRQGVQWVTVCFVRGNTAQLKSLLNESLVIHGREYWVQGVRPPVVIVERIERRVR
ncbi:MAG: SH3 domain-containing protein [Kiritimatiellae bacterium]|nr:SH3 domain-containing protein [Kiritimatiellia bacterium]MDW8458224.1 SH3 domain-containing protein [Verrucomicrobiota bacterium]